VEDRDARAREGLRRIYARTEGAIALLPGLFCLRSGRCCRFREAGHELYLTRLEYDEMVARGGGARAADPNACPWLENGLCGNREGRALACRTYFCSDEERAAEVTEEGHRAIRRLHDELGIPYDYRSLTDHANSRGEDCV